MASILKTVNGTWRVQIERGGRREYKTLPTKALALAWANQRESDLNRGLVPSVSEAQKTPFADIIDAFRRDVLPSRRNRSDRWVLNTLEERFGQTRLIGLHTKDIARFKKDRLAQGKAPATVVKELNLLRFLIDYAIEEEGIYLPSNQARLVRNPPVNNERDRVFMEDEEERLFKAFPNDNYRAIATLALETACRLGELLKMRWDYINFPKRTLRLPKEITKTAKGRAIPLSPKAIATLQSIPRPIGGGRVFSCWKGGDSFENGYRRAVARARRQYEEDCRSSGIETHPSLLVDLRFHDFRHVATTRLAEIFNLVELARITGHTNLKMLQRYYHVNPEALAERLASRSSPST